MNVTEFAQFFDIDEDEAIEIFEHHTMLNEVSIGEVRTTLAVFCEFDMNTDEAKTFGYIFPQILLLSPEQLRNRLLSINKTSSQCGESLKTRIIRTPNLLIEAQTVETRITIL